MTTINRHISRPALKGAVLATAIWAACPAVPVSAGTEETALNTAQINEPIPPSDGIAGVSIAQDFETFSLGSGCNQAGWMCGAAPGDFQIVNSGITGFGNRSARDTAVDAFGILQEIRSPSLPAAEPGFIAADIVINDTTSLWQFAPANLLSGIGFLSTRVNFEANGTITVMQMMPEQCPSGGTFVATTGTWTPNVKFRIAVEVQSGNVLRVYKNGALIFTGTDICQVCNPSDPDIGITQVRIINSNVGNTSTLTLDNISTVGASNACVEPVGTCAGDVAPVGGNQVVNVDDLLAVINTWGQNANPNGPRPQGDTRPLPNGNCMVNVDDLLGVINEWGTCPPPSGACCLPNGSCLPNQTELQCLIAGGIFQGDAVPCSAGLCPIQPGNDECAGATTLANGVHLVSNAAATTSPGIPGGECAFLGAANFTRDVWFRYIATCTGTLTVDTCGTTGSVTDTVLALLQGPCTSLSELACDDDSCGQAKLLSQASISVTSGQLVFIRVGSYGTTPAGEILLTIGCVAPNNDACADAIALTAPATVSGSLAGATQDTAPQCSGVPISAGRWYTIIGTGKTLTASTCTGPSQVWNGKISVYCANSCADLTCVTGVDNNTCNLFQETATWCGVSGQKYWILVHTDSAPADGNYTLTVTESTNCTSTVVCPPPSNNDECIGATPLTCGQTVTVIAAQYEEYTDNTDDPVTSCEIAGGGPNFHDAGWWYRFTTGPAQTSLRITMCATNPTFDTVIGLFSGGCGGLTEVACNDDFCTFPAPGPSEFCAVVQPNTQYWIHVNHYAPPQPGNYTLTVDCATVCTAPTCGPCVGVAEGVPCSVNGDNPNLDPNGGCNVTPASFGPAIALNQTRCGVHSTFVGNAGGNFRDLDWYLFTPTVSGSHTIQVCTNFPGTAAFLTNGTTNITTCTAGGPVVALPGAANFPANTQVNITSTLTAGTTYAVVVGPSMFTGVPCPPAGQTNSRFKVVQP